MDVSYSFGKVVSSNKRNIELVLITLILLHFAPFECFGEMGVRLEQKLNPLFNPIRTLLSVPLMKIILYLMLLSSVFIKTDKNLSILLILFFMIG